MKKKICRRQFLKGVGGISLGLPFLPSLMPGKAYGADPEIPVQKRFVSITTNHGGIFESAMYPGDNTVTETLPLYGDHSVRRGDLSSSIEGNNRVISNVLSAPQNAFSSELVSKMNVMRGLDIPFYIAHHTGGHLGNFARNDGNGEDGQSIQDQYMPTIDQLMAWSNSFYTDLTSVTERSLITGTLGRMSYGWSNPTGRTGNIEAVEHHRHAEDLFDKVFRPPSESQETFSRSFIVDRVLENYQSLRQSNRRISSSDRQRLDDHMDRLYELQRRLSATTSNASLCQNLALGDIDYDSYISESNSYIEVVEAAFLCGSSAIAVLGMYEPSFEEHPDWHQAVAHRWNLEEPQQLLQSVNRSIFEHVFLNLANKLNVEEGPDCNILDNTLIAWTQESGEATHESRSAPVITCGSAGGFLSTGNYCDYRNLSDAGVVYAWGQAMGASGLLHSQWLATALQAMGLSPSEWQDIPNNATTGYGLGFISPDYTNAQQSGVKTNASTILPFLGA